MNFNKPSFMNFCEICPKTIASSRFKRPHIMFGGELCIFKRAKKKTKDRKTLS
jgi:hypothetical protein